METICSKTKKGETSMNKINGYTEEEAKNLVEFIKQGKQKGKTLTYLFETYGVEHGRAKGSVRNYYYTLMKNEKGDERIVRLLDGSCLSVEKIKEFTIQKNYHYSSAYEFLSVAKCCANIVDKEIDILMPSKNEEIVNEVLGGVKKGTGRKKLRLISSFGKLGFFDLDSCYADIERTINLVGIYGSEYKVINEIFETYNNRKLFLVFNTYFSYISSAFSVPTISSKLINFKEL
jgi:hypothetical protein